MCNGRWVHNGARDHGRLTDDGFVIVVSACVTRASAPDAAAAGGAVLVEGADIFLGNSELIASIL
jgi:hypothetical protein